MLRFVYIQDFIRLGIAWYLILLKDFSKSLQVAHPPNTRHVRHVMMCGSAATRPCCDTKATFESLDARQLISAIAAEEISFLQSRTRGARVARRQLRRLLSPLLRHIYLVYRDVHKVGLFVPLQN
jgi:hypothetical protein